MRNGVAKTSSLGIQHVLAMYAGAVIVPLIVGNALKMDSAQLTYLVSVDIVMCGIATILQVWQNRFFGIGLPIVLGCTFTAVGPIISIGSQYGMAAIYGAIIASGLFVVLSAGIFSKLLRFFPPVVTGSVVTVIGITLIPVAMNDMAGGVGSKDFGSFTNIALSFGTLLFILAMYRFAKGFIRSISILLGLAAGTIVASFTGKVNLAAVGEASWFKLPEPFYFAAPEFHAVPILTMILVAIVGIVEATGVYLALADICERKLTDEEMAKGYRAEGAAIVLGGIFNAFPYTTYSQNVGLVQLSGVKSKNVIYTAGAMLVVLGLVPKIAALTTVIPTPVLGGAMVAMFGMVIAYGIKMLSKVEFASQENLLIIACSVGIGLGVTAVPDFFSQLPEGVKILTNNGIVAGSITAIVLNLFFNVFKPSQRSEAVKV
ncbi:nucleobase:cation symporter-2 family protein [Bacillus sp. FJAT-27245]|uniref:nucleobase:cation symporter-2 family protein n=1 Tax=Bacillus sp. FJAT-27245 TaxID=1684144 RepID=UPI0006A7BD51|nr:nucleobase:cation symporter-2 family protein [Bacillus sp. FJAT-27245]